MSFRYAYGPYLAKDVVMKDGVSIDQGEMVEIESAEADYGVSGSTTLVGIAAESVDNAADGESISVIVAQESTRFAVVDATARVISAPLDINGTFDGVTTSSNKDVVVAESCTATEDTIIMIHPKKTAFYNA